ncbi:NEK10 [Symbiodinium sp. CCMP2456]|nr:NEK10 [Symbiodinium sp. CCMP2456]
MSVLVLDLGSTFRGILPKGRAWVADVLAMAEEEASVEDWRGAVAELKQVDQTIEELRQELRQFEIRRGIIANREALLRQRLAAAGQVVTPPAGTNESTKSTFGGASDEAPSEASPSREPVMFNIDDDAGYPKITRPTSLEDWEQGLEMLNAAGQTRDRAASLRAHWLMNGGKTSGNSPVRRS